MDIFIINTSVLNNINGALLEEFRHKEFSNEQKKKEHCLAYLMLDRILKEVYQIENREIKFVNQKPYLKTREKYFSLSHSGEYIAIAISGSECGVDIEKIKQRDFMAISDRMGFNSKTLDEFYADWTKYEAKYKLGRNYESIMQTEFKGYMISAVSSNIQEKFEIFIQNGEEFPKL